MCCLHRQSLFKRNAAAIIIIIVLVLVSVLVAKWKDAKNITIIMYIDLELQSSLQPFVRFDWRLIAERGLRCYGHFHRLRNDAKTVASCELNFLLKARTFSTLFLRPKSRLSFWTKNKPD